MLYERIESVFEKMMILCLSVSKSWRTVTLFLSLVLEELNNEAKFNNFVCGSISGVRRIQDPFSKVVDQVGISLLLASVKILVNVMYLAFASEALVKSAFQIKEGLAFVHCTTCKSPYHIRVHGVADRKWQTLKFRLFWFVDGM
ncbi:hypothetical protein ACS0TY_019196 [Phlomoides rotata]